jgi:6-phosphogluconate dehydrogenase
LKATVDRALCELGVVGLGVMGANLALNVAEHGFPVVGHDHTTDKIDAFRHAVQSLGTTGVAAEATADLAEFVARLRPPRVILLLVPAGSPVDSAVQSMLPLLRRQDIIIDGGNSHFIDTDRRASELVKNCIHFVGMGVSGGEYGARHGPSLMPGGSKAAWERMQRVLEAVAAKANGESCVAWLGRNSAGHYVKMVHNGIEYGLMQLIAESYDLMKRGLGMHEDEMRAVFEVLTQGDASGYLLEITAAILPKRDTPDVFLLDRIQDAARQKGTGMWTSQEAMQIQVPTPVIDAAVVQRALSDYKAQREAMSRRVGSAAPLEATARKAVLDALGPALYGAMLMTYAQGMHLLQRGSQEHSFGIPLRDVARVWRAGCIIRSRILEELQAVYARDPAQENPIFDPALAQRLGACDPALRTVATAAVRAGVPVPAYQAALAYFDAWRSARLPANLIQAQRDYFGAHRFERVDTPGNFHIDWMADGDRK